MDISTIAEKCRAGVRISNEEAIRLFDADILELGSLADEINRSKNGNRVYYNLNRHINYTNICKGDCEFCAFRKDAEDEKAYTLTLTQIMTEAASAASAGATELHIVGGLNPNIPFDFYLELLAAIKADTPSLHIKAFTAVEIDFFAHETHQSVESVLKELHYAGLGSLPGGGAEILVEPVRSKICPEKISGERWLEIMELAHLEGLKSNATMLFGHVETHEERIGHMQKLRELQDKTAGFQAFVPLPYQGENNRLSADGPDGIDILKTIAISRLYLDNFQTIKAYWVMTGVKLAQVALQFGANDLDGTVVREQIGHDAGASSPSELVEEDIVSLISNCGKEPVERDSLYRMVER